MRKRKTNLRLQKVLTNVCLTVPIYLFLAYQHNSKAQDALPQSGTLSNIPLHNKTCCHSTVFIHRN